MKILDFLGHILNFVRSKKVEILNFVGSKKKSKFSIFKVKKMLALLISNKLLIWSLFNQLK